MAEAWNISGSDPSAGLAVGQGGTMAYDNDANESPFMVPPLPQPEDDGTAESRSAHPNRVPSRSEMREGSQEGSFVKEGSIYPAEGQNPLVANRNPHRGSQHRPAQEEDRPFDDYNPPAGYQAGAQDNTDGFGPRRESTEDPFAQGGDIPPRSVSPSMGVPPLNLKRVGSVQGTRRLSRQGSLNQPSLHEVMYHQKIEAKGSLESRLISTRHSTGSGDDPFKPPAPGGHRRSSDELRNSISATNPMGGGGGKGPQIITRSPQRSPSQSNFTSEERKAAESADSEELFLPNLQREQFIPVRVARDKIKQVLAEMAHMRSLHLAALDTMEKQQAFLKAQLEAATAAYVKKLTSDYNNRVTALEAEYKRRLENLNSSAMGTLTKDLENAKKKIEETEKRAMQKIADRERELEQEQKLFLAKMEFEKSENAKFAKQVEERNAKISTYEQRIAELEEMLAKAEENVQRARSRQSSAAPTPGPADAQLQELESKFSRLQRSYDEEVSQRQAFEQQAVALHEQLIEAKRSAAQADVLQENEALKAENMALREQLLSLEGAGADSQAVIE